MTQCAPPTDEKRSFFTESVDKVLEEELLLQMNRQLCKAIGITKSQGNNFTKEYSKPPVTGPKEIEI